MKRKLILLLCAILTGCSFLPSERTSCPQTAIVSEFSKHILLKGNIDIRTELDSISPSCTQFSNETYIDFRLRMTSFRPLSASSKPLKHTVSYFVVVTDNKGNILSRSDHDLEISFEGQQTTKVSHIRLLETVPAKKEVSLYVGFNLDEKQFRLLQDKRTMKIK